MRCVEDGILYFRVPQWDPQRIAIQGFFGRVGGVSLPPFDSLNTGIALGDDPCNVQTNLSRIRGILGVPRRPVIFMKQVHGDHILSVTKDSPRNAADFATDPQGDGICTDRTDVLLAVRTADCLPICILDSMRPAVAIVHAGWRGTLKKILKKCIEEMSLLFDTRTEVLNVAIGPGIRSCCFLVDGDVADQFAETFPGDSPIVRKAVDGKWSVDLYGANIGTALEMGVPEENVFLEPLCTCCNRDSFFSARRAQGEATGRQISLVGLNPF